MMGWLHERQIVEAQLPGLSLLERFHGSAYVTAFKAATDRGEVTISERKQFGFGTMENPIFPGLFERACATVGGSIAAAQSALDGTIAFHPAGGTHHGKPDRSSGFCYFNDPAFAIATFLDSGLDRILYFDLDAHHGDGVEQIFADDDRVTLVSLHEADRWPFTGTADRPGPGNAVNIVLPRGSNDSELAWMVGGPLAEFARAMRPQAIVITAGADCLHGDPLSAMEWSNGAWWQAVATAVRWAPRAVVLGGGGYNPWTVTRGWAGLWATLAGHNPGAPLPATARAFLAGFESDLIDADEIEAEWVDSIADTPRPGPIRRETRRGVHAALDGHRNKALGDRLEGCEAEY